MSQMEFYIGTYKKSGHSYEPEDTDDFYDLENEHGCYFVKVNGVLYESAPLPGTEDIDAYGFSKALPGISEPIIIAYWHNGGAGVHEVIEDAIKASL